MESVVVAKVAASSLLSRFAQCEAAADSVAAYREFLNSEAVRDLVFQVGRDGVLRGAVLEVCLFEGVSIRFDSVLGVGAGVVPGACEPFEFVSDALKVAVSREYEAFVQPF